MPPAEPGRLIALGHSPDGFLRILANWENILRPTLSHEDQLQDYFALCLACHHATVATFVPTDVDTKIRGIVWHESRDPGVLRPMLYLALASRAWTEDGISIRAVRGVSGHNGEQWSAIAGGLGRLLELGDAVGAEEAQAAIEAEIDREQSVFDQVAAERDAEIDLLRLAMTLAHNRGDLTQGMGFWKRTPVTTPANGASLRARPVRPGRAGLSRHGTFGRRAQALSAASGEGAAALGGDAAAAVSFPRRLGRRGSAT